MLVVELSRVFILTYQEFMIQVKGGLLIFQQVLLKCQDFRHYLELQLISHLLYGLKEVLEVDGILFGDVLDLNLKVQEVEVLQIR